MLNRHSVLPTFNMTSNLYHLPYYPAHFGESGVFGTELLCVALPKLIILPEIVLLVNVYLTPAISWRLADVCHKPFDHPCKHIFPSLAEMPIYGYCPRWEDFYLVVCDVCGHAIKPQALKQHIGKIWS